MGALKAAAVRLGGLREGRKSIIFVSEGFDDAAAQLNDPIAAMPGVGNPYRGGRHRRRRHRDGERAPTSSTRRIC